MSFNQEFDQHGVWRKQFALRLKLLSEWLTDHDLMEPGVHERLDQLRQDTTRGFLETNTKLKAPRLFPVVAPARSGLVGGRYALQRVIGRGANGAVHRATDTVTGAPVAVKVAKGKVSCKTARKVIRAYVYSDADCAGEACVRKHYGWRCRLHFEDDFPLLASCARARVWIGAYSTAKDNA